MVTAPKRAKGGGRHGTTERKEEADLIIIAARGLLKKSRGFFAA
jgi:hypothetical protein